MRVVALNVPKKRAFMHLDTILTMVDPESFPAYPGQMDDKVKMTWRIDGGTQIQVMTSDTTKEKGFLWMEPDVWTEHMQFYLDNGQIDRLMGNQHGNPSGCKWSNPTPVRRPLGDRARGQGPEHHLK